MLCVAPQKVDFFSGQQQISPGQHLRTLCSIPCSKLVCIYLLAGTTFENQNSMANFFLHFLQNSSSLECRVHVFIYWMQKLRVCFRLRVTVQDEALGTTARDERPQFGPNWIGSTCAQNAPCVVDDPLRPGTAWCDPSLFRPLSPLRLSLSRSVNGMGGGEGY